MSFLLRVALLTLLWILAWGEISPGFVLSGLAVSTLLLLAFPPSRDFDFNLRFSPVGALRLVWFVAGQLIVSNLLVAREILSRRSKVRYGVIAYRMRGDSDEVLTLVSNVIALTPGTMTVEATREPPVVYVHFLLLSDVESVRLTIARIEELSIRALAVASFETRPEHEQTKDLETP